ncbi:hypothetical protein Leryth_011491 [Lithospermum erythrorhizon]|uniref:DNA-binding transcription factor n=1 Tax=Lithospermum erythrorhizon TaxID=34254 RepID=A0AAV3RGB7_LITER|nr:hypothetical protein Leryth_011491 [Lithospermum erythrorhizon]
MLPRNLPSHNPERRYPRPEKLFDKVITNSDIKLCRLALPKLQAKKHFPLHEAEAPEGTLICMQDFVGKTWRFRFTFWKSCQGYVFTSDWNQFVREKGLKAGDVICFLRSTSQNNMQLFVDFKKRPENNKESDVSIQEPKDNEDGSQDQSVQQPFKLFGVRIKT